MRQKVYLLTYKNCDGSLDTTVFSSLDSALRSAKSLQEEIVMNTNNNWRFLHDYHWVHSDGVSWMSVIESPVYD